MALHPRPTWRRGATLALAAATGLALLAGCGDEDGSGAEPASAGSSAAPSVAPTLEPDAAPLTTFRVAAARACTEAVDQAMAAGPLPDTGVVFVGVVRGREPAPEAERTGWADTLDAHAEVLRGIAAGLAGVDAPAEATDWDAFVASYDDAAVSFGARAAVLRDGSEWSAVKTVFEESAGTSPLAGVLPSLGLDRTDCAIAGNPQPEQPAADAVAFVSAASQACTDVVTRRWTERWAEDVATVGQVVSAASGGPVEPTDPLRDALARGAEEWRETSDALAGVDAAGAPDPAAWQEVLDLAAERADGWQARLDAAEDGDPAALASALTAPWERPTLDLAPVGLAQRSCAGVDV
ncbi:hypothetical protein [Nocardioides litoris]|uniref:hypothetical protein n=1 Tax=Nocardioides litoris TaxID=1926648 RepID=UPI001120F27A|nr:hypothetical protein [Nocardioides litoris]